MSRLRPEALCAIILVARPTSPRPNNNVHSFALIRTEYELGEVVKENRDCFPMVPWCSSAEIGFTKSIVKTATKDIDLCKK